MHCYHDHLSWLRRQLKLTFPIAVVTLCHGFADNLKLTFPIAAATFQMAWGIASRPGSGTGVDQEVFNEIRWGTDYLLACFGNNSLVTQA